MRRIILLITAICLTGFIVNLNAQTGLKDQLVDEDGNIIRTQIDNIDHWVELAEKGLVPFNQSIPVRPAEPGSSMINIKGVVQNSPDIVIYDNADYIQSENSVFVDPNNKLNILNSNNSRGWDGSSATTGYGSSYFNSYNGGYGWSGSYQGAGGTNKGDPTTCIGTIGRKYIGSISSGRGQGVAWSDNGTTWNYVTVGANVTYPDLLDKNHMWIDNTTSGQAGNLYDAWTRFDAGHANDTEIEFSRSTDDGISWTTPYQISSNIAAGSHNQGVNICCNNTGWVFATWVVYDDWGSGVYGEDAIAFARSSNGGVSFNPAVRIHDNILGIRQETPNPTGKNMRVNSFPSMTIDVSGGTYHGHQYIVWSNVGVPGTNTGTNVSIYMIKSTNGGTVWSTPVRVNQGTSANGYASFFPWITCDPVTGNLFCIFYDDRNLGSASSAVETWLAYSTDGGSTWDDFKISDVSFTPSPVPGLAAGYFGDYLGVTALDNFVYPAWTDNRSGRALTYVSPFAFGGPCIALGGGSEYISNVQVGSISNPTGSDKYTDYTNLSTNIPLNDSESLTVTMGNPFSASDQCGVWVDWNQDEDFDDANETISVTGTPGLGPYTATIDPPAGAILGECVMRVRITYSGAVEPCGSTSFGEVEDYTINVSPVVANVWDGSANHYWHQALNWSLGRIPIDIDPVVIPNVGYQPVYVDDYPSVLSEYCASLTVESGATLEMRDQSLTIDGNMNISGELGMVDASTANSVINVMGNVAFNSGSTWNVTASSSFINVYQDWNFNTGANANATLGFVDFRGTTSEFIRCYSSNSSFYNLRNYKSGGAYLGFSGASTESLVVNNLTFITSGAIFNSYSSQNIVMKGAFNYYGPFDFSLSGNTGSVIFDGINQTIYKYSTSSGVFNNIVFSSTTGTTIGNGDIVVANNITIEEGNLNPGANNITLGGNWTNTGGTVTSGTSLVTFSSNGAAQDVTGTNSFYDVYQVDAGQYLRFHGPTTIQNNLELHHFCWAYSILNVNGILNINDVGSKFTTNGPSGVSTIASLAQGGSVVCNGTATITINNVTPEGIFGKYYVNNASGTLNLINPGWVDLNGEIHIAGGTMNVTGTVSDWPYSADALIDMSDGVLDFTSCGISIVNNAHTLTSNITGGLIRTSAGFSGNRADFTPNAGTFEFYGSTQGYISQSNGCTLHNVIIDKVAKSTSPVQLNIPISQEEKVDITKGDGSKANDILLGSNFTVTNNLTVNSGVLTIGAYELTVAHQSLFYGTLNMTDPAGIFNTGSGSSDVMRFYTGSIGNLSAGSINIRGWIVPHAGCNFTATTGNTIYFIGDYAGGGIGNNESTAVYGNIEVNKTSFPYIYLDGLATENIVVDGNFTLHPNNIINMQDGTMIVHGILTDASTSEINVNYAKKDDLVVKSPDISSKDLSSNSESSDQIQEIEKSGSKAGYLEIDNNFTLNGLMDVGADNVYLHGNFSTASTGTLNIAGGSVICDAPNGTDIWYYLDGTFNITSGIFEISNNSINFGSSSINTISGGTLRTGGAFYANYTGTFLPTGGIVEVIGAVSDNAIYCTNGNYFYDLIINRQPGYGAYLQTEVEVQNDLTINSGFLNTNNYNFYIGGDWTNNVGTAGFVEGSGTVTFNSSGDVSLSAVGGENFYNLTIDKGAVGSYVSLSDNIDVAGDLLLNTGAIYSYDNNIMVSGNVTINSAGFLYMMANGTLGVGDGMNLNVNSGGYLYALGTSGNPATITNSSTGNYNFNVYSGALMGAQYALFDFMTSNGVFLRPGSLVHSTYTFNYCTFQNGTPGYPTLFNIATNESFTSVGANFPDAGSATYNTYKYSGSTGQTIFQDAVGAFAGESFDYDPGNNIIWEYTTRTLDLTVFLEGPFNSSTNKMDLGLNSILPLNQPFDTPPLSNPSPDWYYTGTESVAAIPNVFIVDWVLVELRDATSVTAALPGTAIFTQAAFITNTGQIVDLDGLNPLTFTGTITNNLYAVVWIRNHLGVISANPLVEAGGIHTYDFSSGSGQAEGGISAQHQLSTSPAIWGVIPGDANATGLVAIGDKTNVWWLQAGITGYLESDYNFDGEADNIDKNDNWFPNLGDSSFIPE